MAHTRTAYIYRPVTNGKDIMAWAKANGIENVLVPDDMHITVVYSKTPVDWDRLGNDYSETVTIPEAGNRYLDLLGPNRNVLALVVQSGQLRWRHEEAKDAGASWDWPEYRPHVTISPAVPDDFGIDAIEPFQGQIDLGPEVFEEIYTDWKPTTKVISTRWGQHTLSDTSPRAIIALTIGE